MFLDVCLGTRTAWKILLVLAEAPGKAVSRKDIQKLTKLGNKFLSKSLILLEKFNIILQSKIGKAYYYKLNLNNPFIPEIIEIIQTEKKETNNLDFFIANILREFAYEILNINIKNIHGLILFGSYAKRTYNANSDIDVAVILNEKSPDDELMIAGVIDKIKKRFGKKIQLHYYSKKEFDEIKKKDRLVMEIVKDGIVLI
jgi:predicted nucleotidyltransferase